MNQIHHKCSVVTFCIFVFLTTTAVAQSNAGMHANVIEDPQLRLSIGHGIIYGGDGLKGEIRLLRGLMGSVGLGFSAMDRYDGTDFGPGINGAAGVGLSYYLPLKNATWRPRIGVSYGENQWHAFVHDMDSDPGYMGEPSGRIADNGPSLSSGIVWQIKEVLTFEADLFYTFRKAKTTAARDHSSPWQVAMGFGITWGREDANQESFAEHPR